MQWRNRRTLHQPFFPLPSLPPSSPQAQTPNPSPPFPKYPFSTNPQQPFFPDYPSPPPPPPSSGSSVPTFPANISSLIYPSSSHSTPGHHSPHSNLLPAILSSLIVLSLLALSAAFLFHRRRRRLGAPDHPAAHKLDRKPPSCSPATSPPPTAAPPTSNFLYLGTLVDNRTTTPPDAAPPPPASESPELRPLPPLSKNRAGNYGNSTDSDDEFYSPKGSDANGSSSRRNFEAVVEKCGSRNSDLSTPSYSDSNSAGSLTPIGSSPAKDPTSGPPPPHPPPPPSLRPLTPAPPKRKPPPLSPVQHERSARLFERSPAIFKESNGIARTSEPLGQNSRSQAPPPPPPPPPVGYWESQIRKRSVHASPKSVGLKKPLVEFSTASAEFAGNSESVERNEETPRPKLKPLHWDKVRASSDRIMVWDQLKSSSFQ